MGWRIPSVTLPSVFGRSRPLHILGKSSATNLYPQSFLCLQGAWCYRVPQVVHSHDLLHYGPTSWLYHLMLRISVQPWGDMDTKTITVRICKVQFYNHFILFIIKVIIICIFKILFQKLSLYTPGNVFRKIVFFKLMAVNHFYIFIMTFLKLLAMLKHSFILTSTMA